MRIAIIGTGISALSTAFYLDKKIDIDLYDSEDRVGGHTDTHLISLRNKETRVDTGFIVCNDRNYKNFFHKESKENIEVLRCPLYVPSKPNTIKRLVHLITFSLSSFLPVFFSFFWKPDIVIQTVPTPVSYTHLTLPTTPYV